MKFCYGENDLSSNRERHFVLSSNFLAAIGLPQSLLALVLLLSEGEGLHTYAVSKVITQEKKKFRKFYLEEEIIPGSYISSTKETPKPPLVPVLAEVINV